MFLSIVIPAYNEEKRIGQTLSRYLRHYSSEKVEFIVVLDGCTDNTLGVVKTYIPHYPDKLHYLDIANNIGKGHAVREGLKLAKGKLIGFVDADGSTSPDQFDLLIQSISDYDGAIASRWKKGSEVINRKLVRQLISFGFVFFVKIIFWFPYADTQCGAKIFKRELIKSVLPKLKVANMAFDVEMIYRSRRMGFSIVEVPTRWVDETNSTIGGSFLKIVINGIKMFFTLLKIRLRI